MHWRYVTSVAMAGLLAACSKAPTPLQVEFVPTFGESVLSCGGPAGLSMTDLRFYVHNLRLEDVSGEVHRVQLEPGDWQQEDLALLDLEDGSGNCINGTGVTNAIVRGTVSGEKFRALEFTLGVPFEQNHADPLLAASPLGDADMHWHWRGGYKFLRAGIRSDTDSFWLHLGSTGCKGTIQNITGCNAPNRVTVRLEDYTPGDAIAVDLAALVGSGTLADAMPTDCSSGPAEKHCSAAFAALGLAHATGEQAGSQRLFSLQRAP